MLWCRSGPIYMITWRVVHVPMYSAKLFDFSVNWTTCDKIYMITGSSFCCSIMCSWNQKRKTYDKAKCIALPQIGLILFQMMIQQNNNKKKKKIQYTEWMEKIFTRNIFPPTLCFFWYTFIICALHVDVRAHICAHMHAHKQQSTLIFSC